MESPEPGAPGVAAAAVVDPVEALEDPVQVAGRDPDAAVLDGEPHVVALLGPHIVAAGHVVDAAQRRLLALGGDGGGGARGGGRPRRLGQPGASAVVVPSSPKVSGVKAASTGSGEDEGGLTRRCGAPAHGAGHDHLGLVVGVGDGVLEEGVHGGDQLAAFADHGDRRGGLVQDDLDAALIGRGADPFDGVGHDEVDQYRFRVTVLPPTRCAKGRGGRR